MSEDIDILKPFNPLDKRNLAESIAEKILLQPVSSMPPSRFIGAGVYAIYYIGDFPLYQKIAERNRNDLFLQPIYVGKAVPPGARKGGFGLGGNPGMVLFQRLNEHAKSIEEAENLSVEDFYCRFLAIDDIWIPLAESLLIEKTEPLWNRVIDGFGNHDPGSGRYNQKKSQWDTIHPGRGWSSRLEELDEISVTTLRNNINSFLASHYNG